MNEQLCDTLQVCLEALEAGADPDFVAHRFPEMENDLLPLLETSRRARMLARPDVPAIVLRRNRARVMQRAAGMRAQASSSKVKRAVLLLPRLALSLAIWVLFLTSGTGLVRASGGALPGDNLYPVKRTWEDVRLLLVFQPERREALENEFERERLHEIDELLAEGRHETIAFTGVVTEQSGNLWVVSGVPVQITAESRLPGLPVTVGTSIKLQGRTNARGFIEADFIEVLKPQVVLPTSVPTQVEANPADSKRGPSRAGENHNSDEKEKLESSRDGDRAGDDPDSGEDHWDEEDRSDYSDPGRESEEAHGEDDD